MNTNTELLNFNIPTPMKRKFYETCRSRNQQMTSVLNQFIADFINDHQPTEDTTLPLEFFFDDEPRL